MTASDDTAPLTIATETSPSDGTIRAVESGLAAHATGLGLKTDWSPRWIIGRDKDGVVQAGVRFVLAFEWLFVNWLWVADAYRQHGVGSKLMSDAEAAARAQGCRAAYLDTFTFQAPKFYERQGYREFGRLNDFPPGHSRIWFSKALR
ncbi:MAG: GNAT family N-acetyltransferase [Hyphomicrobiales bacterium]|nr:GNAT family N-acetyltransferase [Hyphomicrobiales bacterium]MBV9910057.1 GNAT family N-acetyltransferase [Hyphomicrobiales bacterium]